jgi:hypothetical protein
MPYKSALKPKGQHLAGPDGQSIPCWGERTTDLIFNGRRFAWTFQLADVQFPIIGVDFLRHFRLLVDIAAGRLVDTASSQSFPIISESSVAGANIVSLFQELLRRFPEVVNPDKRLPPSTTWSITSESRTGHPSPPNSAAWMQRSWRWQSGIRQAGARRDHQEVRQPFGLVSSHGPEAGR